MSLFDTFDRNDSDAVTYPRVNHGIHASYEISPRERVRYGVHNEYPGVQTTLPDASTSASTGITFDSVTQPVVKITYAARRGTGVRSGVLLIAADANGSDIDDTFVENGAAIGLTFAVDVTAGTTTLQFTSTSTGDDITFSYQVETLSV